MLFGHIIKEKVKTQLFTLYITTNQTEIYINLHISEINKHGQMNWTIPARLAMAVSIADQALVWTRLDVLTRSFF